MTDKDAFAACAVVPVFNPGHRLAAVVAGLRERGLPVILVDDGSDAATAGVLARLATAPQVDCITLERNQGKGAAVMTGLREAGRRGFTHALQVDADGQHDLADVPRLLDLARRHPGALVSGRPVYDESVPAVRFYGRYLTHALVWLETLSFSLRDSMCGYRVYPLVPALTLMGRVHIGRRMDFDTDIMVRLYRAGTESRFVPTRVRYPEDGVSHFRMLRDNLRMIWLHLRLLAGMVAYIPHGRQRGKRRPTSHWAHIAERGSMAGLRFLGWVDRVLGRHACRVLLAPVAAYFLFADGTARRASRAFLRAAGAHPGWTNRFRQFLNFAMCTTDKVRIWRDPYSIPVDCSPCAHLVEHLGRGRGALMIAAHLGNMEAARAFAQQIPHARITALVHSGNSLMINAMLRNANADYPSRLIQVDAVGADTALLLKSRVDAGEVVVIAGDRIPVSSGGRTLSVPFLGRDAPFALGPYVLAHTLDCPVYLLFCLKHGRGYRMFAEPFAERIHLPRGQREQAAVRWATRYAERLGEYARRYPLQWYNFYDIWAPTLDAAPVSRRRDHAASSR